jgi:hypothetical protein
LINIPHTPSSLAGGLLAAVVSILPSRACIRYGG